MDNDKMFDLLTKMYSEMQGIKIEMQEGFTTVNERLDKVENEVLKTNMKIEQVVEPKLTALFDGHTQHEDTFTRIEGKLNDLTDKVDKHDIKIQVIEGGKRANIG